MVCFVFNHYARIDEPLVLRASGYHCMKKESTTEGGGNEQGDMRGLSFFQVLLIEYGQKESTCRALFLEVLGNHRGSVCVSPEVVAVVVVVVAAAVLPGKRMGKRSGRYCEWRRNGGEAGIARGAEGGGHVK